MLDFLKGKKTYLIALVAGLLAAVQAYDPTIIIPDYVFEILGAFGLTTLRAGISKVQ